MALSTPAPGEKPLLWVGSAKRDLLEFPEAAKDELGTALSVAQAPKSQALERRRPGSA
jgi:phage-related protein